VSTSSVFVFVLAVMAGDETYTHVKLLGVMLGIMGTALTAFHDLAHHDDDDEGEACANGCDYVLWGDSLSLVAAVAYASYAVQVRVLCPRNEDLYSMILLLGYIGLVIMVPLAPVALYLLTQVQMTSTVFWLVVVRGLLDYVLSEYLHFRAVVLTNATTATVGLGLTIPFAFFADWLMDKANVASIPSLMGAIAVSAGFLIVNLSNNHDEEHDGDHKEHPNSGTYEMKESEMRPPLEVDTSPRRGVVI
jgi:solute carrier family 35, member F5